VTSLTASPDVQTQTQFEIEESPLLSVIIPAYNEEHRLPRTLDHLMRYLARQSYPAEVVVVVNGSTDRTAEVVEQYATRFSSVRMVECRARGKGRAVRLGVLQSRGSYLFICDADLSMPIEELDKFLVAAREGYDIAIGSREAPGARRIGEPPHRRVMTRVFALLVRSLALRGYSDTQCGFKLFRRDVARSLVSKQTLGGWGFDVELLYISRKWNYRIAEVPIDWYYNADSRVSPIKDALQMLRDLGRIRWNDLQRKYNSASRGAR
jgi:dolichyl-phosphate beta-glucosyltransferase